MPSTDAAAIMVGLPSPVYRAILEFMPAAIVRLVTERRVVLMADEPEDMRPWEPPPSFEAWVLDGVEAIAEYSFEGWLLARWLRDVRSDAFRESVQCEQLMAEWERDG